MAEEEDDVLTKLPNISHRKPNERARELYKYLDAAALRREDTRGVVKPDTILLSQAQLVCWKLDTRRCLINFLDHKTQYCVADGTRSLHLEDLSISDDLADCMSSLYAPSDAEHSICHYTMNVQAPLNDSDLDGYFEISDLRKDPRFVAVPEKAGSPDMTYYCGTPLRTRKGVSIGALCVFDDKQRPPMTPDELRFLQVIAKNVISHLELLRDKAERKRANKMSTCLNLLVDPESTIQQRRGLPLERFSSSSARTNTATGSSHASQAGHYFPGPANNSPSSLSGSSSTLPVRSSPDKKDPSPPAYVESQSNPSLPSLDGADMTPQARVQEADHINIYKYGSEVLRQALDLERGGGA